MLHHPLWKGIAETVGPFLEAGLNIEAPNKRGERSLHHDPTFGGRDDVVELLKCGANIDAIANEGRTPLHVVLSCRPSTSAVRYILYHETLPETFASKSSRACVLG
jgi:hypothetical protein